MVHEVGHYLGLYHTFRGDSCDGSGDEVSDTPTQSLPSKGCSSKKNQKKDSCSSEPEQDAWWNFMDYTDDHCMQCFSPGQAARIHDSLAVFRPKLLDASTVMPPSSSSSSTTTTTTTTTTTATTTTTTVALTPPPPPPRTIASATPTRPTTSSPGGDPCAGKSRSKFCFGRGDPISAVDGTAAATTATCKCSGCIGGFAGNRCDECSVQMCGPGTWRAGKCSPSTGEVYRCKACPKGSYKLGTSAATVCTRHSGTALKEAQQQAVCGPGYRVTLSTTSATPICKACPLGQYSDGEDGATDCLPQAPTVCASGEQLLNANSTSVKQQCTECPEGSFKSGINADFCTPQSPAVCNAGFRLANVGSKETQHQCVQCPLGTYKTGNDGATSCTPHAALECAAGHEPANVVSVTAARRCTACADGKFSSGATKVVPTCSAASDAVLGPQYTDFCTQLDAKFASEKASLCSTFAQHVCPKECGRCLSEALLAATLSVAYENAHKSTATRHNSSGISEGNKDAMAALSHLVLSMPSNSDGGNSLSGGCTAHNPLQLCGDGKYVSASRVSTTGTYSCETCAPGQYKSGVSTAQRCSLHNIKLCSEGHSLNSRTISATQTCEACLGGQYSDTKDGARACMPQPAATCAPGAYLANKNSTTSKEECVACPHAHYKSGHNSVAECKPQSHEVRVCGDGLYLANLGSKVAPHQCTRCPAGTHKAGTNSATSCTVHDDGPRVCGPGLYIAIPTSKLDISNTNNNTDGNDNGSSNSDDNDAAPGKDHNHSDSCRACERGTYKTGTNAATGCTAQPTLACQPDQLVAFRNSVVRPHSCSQCWKTAATESERAALPRACMSAWRGGRRLRRL